MTLQLHDYQIVARDFLRRQPRAALFLDMGLGKTAATLSALTPEHLPALVVAPKRVAESVWPEERQLWRPDLSLRLAAGSPAQRKKVLDDTQPDITVIGRDNFRDARAARFGPRAQHPWKTLIIDESSGFKSHQSIRYKTARLVVSEFNIPYVWELTGTPSPNGLLDLWAQLAILDGGARLGKNITTFRSRYFTPGYRLPTGVIASWELKTGAEEKIHSLISDVCLSMETEGRITLPPVTTNIVRVKMPPRAVKAYREMKEDLLADLRDLLGGEIHTAANAASMTVKLSQIAAGFVYPNDHFEYGRGSRTYTHLHNEKIDAVREIVEATSSPVLVFYRFAAERRRLMEAFPEARTIGDRETDGSIITDWNAGKIPIMFAHPASAGHGLNLQRGGHTAVWTSLPWSLEEWEQSNKRLLRQGQQHPVVIHIIESQGTVDRTIRDALLNKAKVQDALLEHLESPL